MDTPLTCRRDLILLVEKRVPSSACRRALYSGKVEVLGAFSQIPPSHRPGWIVRVTSPGGGEWLVAVQTNELRHEFTVGYADAVPWVFWTGNAMGKSVYDGDHPRVYADARWEELRKGA